jgi:hypothetical protein
MPAPEVFQSRCNRAKANVDSMHFNPFLPTKMIKGFLVTVFIMLWVSPVPAQTLSTCRATDADAQRLLTYVRQLVTTTDPTRTQLRTSLGLKSMDSTRIFIVTDNSVCNKVAQGINTAQGTPNLIRQLYVLDVGISYAAQDPGHPSGEWWPTVTLDNKYKVLGVVLAP